MAKISSYALDVVVDGNDRWIGSDVSDSLATMNFTPDNLSLYYIRNGFVEPSRAGLIYTFKSYPTTDIKGLFNLREETVNTIALDNTLTEIVISKRDNNRTDLEALVRYMVGHDIKIINPERTNEQNYAIYTINTITEFNTDYLALELTFVTGSAGAELTIDSTVSISSVGGTGSGGGTTGQRIFTGTGAPADSLGNNGDFYVDTATTTWYGPKAGTWPAGVSLIGPMGSIGLHGDSLDLTVDDERTQGNGYLLTITQTEYDDNNNPTTTTPVNRLNIIGPQGPQGDHGAEVLTGPGNPTVTDGVSGDTWINTTTWDLFTRSAGVWTMVGNIRGGNGADGDSVTNATVTNGQLTITLRSGTTFGPFNVRGADGAPGPQGVQGIYNIEIYQRAATEPDTPTGGTLRNGAITTPPTGWSLDVVGTTGTEQLWESVFLYDPANPTAAVIWSAPFQAGSQGPTGPPGPPGTAGTVVVANPGGTGDPLRTVTIGGTVYTIPAGGSNPQVGRLTTTRTLVASFSVPTGNGAADGIVNLLPTWTVAADATVTNATVTGPGIVNPINVVSGTAINLPSQNLAVGTHTWTLTLSGTDDEHMAETETATGSIRITAPVRTQDFARGGFGPATLRSITTFSTSTEVRPNMLDIDSTGTASSSNFYWVLVDRDVTVNVIEDAAGPITFDAVQTVTIGDDVYNGYKSSQTEFDFGGDDSITLTLRYN